MEIPNPLGLPEKLISRLLQVLDQTGPAMEAAVKLEARSEELLEVADRGIAVIERLIATIDAAANHVEPLIETIDAAKEKVDPLISSVDAAAGQVDPLITTLEAALPSLEKAVNLASPLEGSVQRLGQLLDSRTGKRGSKKPIELDEGESPST